MTMDKNKSIQTYADTDGILYNFLNLVSKLVIKKDGASYKGSVEYIYDANGNKLKKITTEGTKVTTTLYLFGNYLNDTLQYLPQEEGRVRYNQDSARFEYDYFLKDHLGNVRMMLTDATKTDAYPPCTMELKDSALNNAFYSNVTSTRTAVSSISGYPTDTSYSNPNQQVAKVNGSGNKIGPAIILKVMAGDKMNVRATDWYNLGGNSPATPYNPLTDLVTALTTSIGGVPGGHATATELATTGALNPGALSYYTTHNSADSTSKPKAFLNWIAFDEQMNYISSSSGFLQVGASNQSTVTPLQQNEITITKNGYFYVYVSNETPNIDVFFDNLQVTHIRGPLLEENHYYPFGLTMQGISSQAIGFGQPTNKKKFVGQEFDDDLGWDTYQFRFRTHDPQIGRFLQVDPLADKYVYNSTYAYAENKPINGIDLEGKEWWGMILAENNSVVNRGPLLENAVKTTSETSAKTPKIEEHHIIPRQLGDNPVMETAKKGGFDLEKSPGENTMPLEKYSKATGQGQHGNAPRYTAEVLKRIGEFQKENPNATAEEAAQFARNLVKNLKEEINNNPNTKLNDLYQGVLSPAKPDNTGKAPVIRVDQVKPKPEKSFYLPVTPA